MSTLSSHPPWDRAFPPGLTPPPTVVCNNRTYHTCMESQLFGLPSPHWCYVQYVRAG